MLNRPNFQTPNALDPGEEVPVRPNRRAPEVGDDQVHSSTVGLLSNRGHSTRQFPFPHDDDDEEHVHDQLPSVEEARMYSARILQASSNRDLAADSDSAVERSRLTNSVPLAVSGGSSMRRSRGRSYFRLFCLLLCVVTLIVIALALSQRVQPSTADSTTPSPVPEVTDATPTLPPVAPHPSRLSVRSTEILQFLSSNYISDPEHFLDMASPQYEAAIWMADRDLLRYKVPTSADDKTTRFIQRYVLVVFYLSTLGPQWLNQLEFLDKTDECSWFRRQPLSDGSVVAVGITCNENSEVEGILMPRNQLKGTLPTELAHLTSLDFVDLNRNDIGGKLPSQFAKLTNLDFFDLRYNDITGPLPDWIGSEWKELVLLGLSNNEITGSIPSTFGQSSLLKTLALDNNHLTGGLDMLNTMTNMEFAFLNDNNLTHPVDDTFLTNIKKLVQLDLSGNMLQSQGIPLHFFQHEKLEVLDLGNNNLAGELPLDIAPNTVLKYVALNNNAFQGTLPPTFDQLRKLTHLDVAGNRLDDEIPASLVSLTGLTYLFLSDNDFTRAPLPSWLAKLELLRELSVGGCGISGTIPSWISSLEQLVLLDLSGNTMTGTVPNFLWDLTNLSYLLLQGNSFAGQLPSGIHDLTDLDLFVLDRNDFIGSVDEVCDTLDPSYLIADCNEVSCSCCTGCCTDSSPDECSDDILYGIMDGSWEYNFTRVRYTFSPDILLDKN